jgi:hypothetical protein
MWANATRWLGIAVIGIVVPSTATLAAPADAPVAVFGSVVGASSQPEGASDRPYLGPGFGGTALSAIVFGDAHLQPKVSVGGEASCGGAISGQQFERVPGGSNQLLSRHRDWIFSAIVKAHSPASSIVQISAGGGVGLARRHTVRTGNFVRDFPPGAAGSVTETLGDNVRAVSGVIDTAVRVNRHLRVLTLFRIYKLDDEDRLPDGVVKRGVSSVIVRYGVGGQVQF